MPKKRAIRGKGKPSLTNGFLGEYFLPLGYYEYEYALYIHVLFFVRTSVLRVFCKDISVLLGYMSRCHF